MVVRNKKPSCRKAQTKSVQSDELNLNNDSTNSAKDIDMKNDVDAEVKTNSNNDIKLSLSTGVSVFSEYVTNLEPTWGEFKVKMSKSVVGTKDGSYFLRGHCSDNLRSNDNMSDVYLLVVDGDSSINPETGEILPNAPDPEKVLEAVQTMDLEAFLYTSYSHGDEEKGNRWRLVVPLQKTILAEQIEPCTNHLHHLLNEAGINVAYSSESSKVSQPWYEPRCPEERIDDFYCGESTGKSFDVKAALNWDAMQPKVKALKTAEPATIDDSTPIGWYNANNPVAKLLSDNGYKYDSSTSSSGEVIHRYLSPDSTTGSPGIIHFENTNRVYSHGTSDLLAGEHAHDAFSIAATMNHAGDQEALLAKIRPEFEEYTKQRKISELVNLKSQQFLGVPEEKIELLEKVLNLTDMEYQFKRKNEAKDIGFGVVQLDKFRKEYSRIQNEIDTLQSDDSLVVDNIPTNIADMVVSAIASEATLFHDDEEKPYITVHVNGHNENYLLTSKKSKSYIRRFAHKKFKKSLDDSTLKTVISSLSGCAEFDGELKEVNMRVAKHDDKYYIDTGNSSWEVIEVDKSGYRTISDSPVIFIRTGSMTALPSPVAGNIDRLWDFVHIEDEGDQLRWLTGLIDGFRPDTDYPVMSHTGSEGSGKTSLLRMFRALTDPSTLPTRGAPSTLSDLQVSAANNHVLAFENMSKLSAEMSDDMCRIATGSGNSKRTLYSDSDETILKFKKLIIIEGIPFVLVKPDIIDRSVAFNIPSLTVRKGGSQITTERDKALPEIFGAILDIFSQSLAVLDSVSISVDVRLIDYARLGQAIYQVLGQKGDFSVDLAEHQNTLRLRALEGSPAILALLEWTNTQPVKSWEGTPGNLLGILNSPSHISTNGYTNKYSSSVFPKSGKGMADLFSRHTKTLKGLGITIEDLNKHSRNGNLYEITW